MTTIRTNLNYFLALFITVSMFALWLVAPFLGILFVSAGAGANSITWSNGLVVVFVFVALALAWKRRGALLPSSIKTGAETRYRVGNLMLAAANVVVVLSLLVSVAGYIFISNFGLAVGFIIAGALLLAVPICTAGVICVETARLRNSGTPEK